MYLYCSLSLLHAILISNESEKVVNVGSMLLLFGVVTDLKNGFEPLFQYNTRFSFNHHLPVCSTFKLLRIHIHFTFLLTVFKGMLYSFRFLDDFFPTVAGTFYQDCLLRHGKAPPKPQKT